MTPEQRAALYRLCERYQVPFYEENYKPTFDLPAGWVAGMVDTIYVGVSPEGDIAS